MDNELDETFSAPEARTVKLPLALDQVRHESANQADIRRLYLYLYNASIPMPNFYEPFKAISSENATQKDYDNIAICWSQAPGLDLVVPPLHSHHIPTALDVTAYTIRLIAEKHDWTPEKTKQTIVQFWEQQEPRKKEVKLHVYN